MNSGPVPGQIRTRTACLSCGAEGLQVWLDLGLMPIVERLLETTQLAEKEPTFPLRVAFCTSCGLSQLADTLPPKILFGDDYPYYSSFSDELVERARRNVDSRIKDESLDGESFVVEIASNDGYLLQHYARLGIRSLGIDPAPGPAAAAAKRGVPTRCQFFDLRLAQELAETEGLADVIHGNNVLAHVPSINDFVAGVSHLLSPSGVAVFEFPYLRDLVHKGEFDTVYHEHVFYFSVTALQPLFQRHGLVLADLNYLTVHGGSLRVFLRKEGVPSERVKTALNEEQKLGMDAFDFYAGFGGRVETLLGRLKNLVLRLKDEGATIAAYGAAAKGVILLNAAGLGSKEIDFVVDRNVHKHGKFLPGSHIPITETDTLLRNQPAYTLLLPWNFREEILSQQVEYRERGGRFIIPVPDLEVV